MICAAKFPKKVEVAAYTQIRKSLKDALSKEKFGRAELDFLADRLEMKAQRETGYARDEALRCVKAIHAFQATFNPRSFSKVEIHPSSKTMTTAVEGVKLNVTLDAMVTATNDDVSNSGGISLLYAFSDRSGIKERLASAAGLILWTLEGGQMEPLPRLCMAADLAGKTVAKASPSFARFRERVAESCKEVAARWGDIAPPNDYDGSDWR